MIHWFAVGITDPGTSFKKENYVYVACYTERLRLNGSCHTGLRYPRNLGDSIGGQFVKSWKKNGDFMVPASNGTAEPAPYERIE